MTFAEEPKDKAKDEKVYYETEISETRYMGEGSPGVRLRKDQTEVSETVYMGEPPHRLQPKHEWEYKRHGERSGRATLESDEVRERWKPRWKKSA